MKKSEKRQLKILCIVLALIALIVCIFLNRDSNKNEDKEYIDTTEIEETSLNWEDIVHTEIFGYEGNVSIDISYDEIPDFQTKLENEYKKWEEKRSSLDPVEDAEEIEAYKNWLEELNKVYSASFCSVPADLNNHKIGDTVKITCDNETLRKLNYKFSDGFEITLDGIQTEKEALKSFEEMEEAKKAQEEAVKNKTSESIENNSSSSNDNNSSSDSSNLDTEQNNYYGVIGDTIVIGIKNIDTVNLIQQKNDDQIILVTVENKSDFEKVKEIALSQGNIDYIQIGMEVYDKESNFKEAEEWKGFTAQEESIVE